jgi:hypothetical protein
VSCSPQSLLIAKRMPKFLFSEFNKAGSHGVRQSCSGATNGTRRREQHSARGSRLAPAQVVERDPQGDTGSRSERRLLVPGERCVGLGDTHEWTGRDDRGGRVGNGRSGRLRGLTINWSIRTTAEPPEDRPSPAEAGAQGTVAARPVVTMRLAVMTADAARKPAGASPIHCPMTPCRASPDVIPRKGKRTPWQDE